ncbi:MAG: hypothetical protein HXY46_07980 [Syntrophaceae bacterium]|nr:hypothetical protein [Syntrophaceae bacterium]
MDLPVPAKYSLDQILSQLTFANPPGLPRKILFWGEGAGGIASYVAGWLAEKEIDVIVVDGTNRFDPYTVSSFAKKALVSPEGLLKKIRIARAFPCYQMATLVGERLLHLLGREERSVQPQKLWVIVLGPISTFLDEDVVEREVRPFFERSLKKMEEMAMKGIPFLLFQSNLPKSPLRKGGERVGMSSRRVYLVRSLFQFSNIVWRIDLEDQGPKLILKKGRIEKYPNNKHQIPSTNTQIITNIQ